MTWNYRIIERIVGKGTPYEETQYFIEEVYYGDEGNIEGWTQSEHVWGISPEEIRQVLEWMLLATEKPVLNEAELEAQTEERPGWIPETGKYEVFDSIEELLESLESEGFED